MSTSTKAGPSKTAAPVLEVRGVTKSFPGVRALKGVDLRVYAGEVHALMGENGAGKSTLMKILAGAYRPDGGEILLDGQPVQFPTPHAARAAGIGIIYQELTVAPNLTVAGNAQPKAALDDLYQVWEQITERYGRESQKRLYAASYTE